MTETITHDDVREMLSTYTGNTSLQEALDNSTKSTITPILAAYVLFNRPFGAGVAYLSAQLATRPDLFRDKKEDEWWNDRSMEVAARVFAAAVDEFGDRGIESHPTHRMLAQATLK